MPDKLGRVRTDPRHVARRAGGVGGRNVDLHSPAFPHGGAIPSRYTCDGEDDAPPLSWSGVPAGARSLVLLCDDSDAPGGTWRHWAVYDIPPEQASFPGGFAPSARGVKQAINDFGRRGYGGPCPPHGHGRHRYRFRLIALDAPALGVRDGVRIRDVERAIASQRVLAESHLVGTYER